jgi:hypothetical protein
VVGISGFLNTLQATIEALSEAISFSGSNDYRFGGCSLFALNPAQAKLLSASGLGKAELKQRIFERCHKRVRDFQRPWLEPRADELTLDDPDSLVPMARSADELMVIVAGAAGAGNHSLVLPSFGNSRPVTRAFTLPR